MAFLLLVTFKLHLLCYTCAFNYTLTLTLFPQNLINKPRKCKHKEQAKCHCVKLPSLRVHLPIRLILSILGNAAYHNI